MKIKNYLVVILLVSFFSIRSYAIVSCKFLMEEKDVKSAGMGDALIIDMFNKFNFVDLSHIIKWANINYEALDFNYYLKDMGNIKGELVFQHQDDFKSIDSIGNIISTDKIYDLVLGIGYGKHIVNKFNGGIKFKYIKSQILNWSSQTFAFDFLGEYTIDKGLYLNIIAENIGYGLSFSYGYRSDNPLPTSLKVGINLLSKRKVLQGKILKRFNFYLNVKYYVYEGFQAGFGSEYCISNILFLRGGYKYSPKNDIFGITTGIGIYYKKFIFSYAFIPGSTLGNTHKFSVQYNW